VISPLLVNVLYLPQLAKRYIFLEMSVVHQMFLPVAAEENIID